MASPTLKALVSPRSGGFPAIKALWEALGAGICVVDPSGKVLLGETFAEGAAGLSRSHVSSGDETLGFVIGPTAPAAALALLLAHLASRESEGRALAS